MAKWYEERRAGDELIRVVPIAADCESSRHLFQVRVNKREEVLMALNEHDIHPGVHYRDNTEYRQYSHGAGTCPNAHLASKEILSLPMHMNVTERDVDYIAQTLKKIVRVGA